MIGSSGIPEDSSELQVGIDFYRDSMVLSLDPLEVPEVKEDSMWSFESSKLMDWSFEDE